MDKQIITFSANEQNLVRIGGECHYSSNKVSYIEAHFDLGQNWSGFDSVRAVWFTDRVNGISTVLDGEGNCTVPTEVLKKKDRVFVNLVGSIVSNGELTDRLTTYPAVALVVDSKAKVDSTETAPVTPSQFEQFVSIVQDAVANIKDIVSTTLNADYTLTFVYSDGTSYTTPSIRGERGPQGADGADGTDGNGIASAVLNSNYTLTLIFTDGTSYTTPSIRGAQGPKGDPGDVSQAQLDAAVSDLKSDISLISDAVMALPSDSETDAFINIPDTSADDVIKMSFTSSNGNRVYCGGKNLFDGEIQKIALGTDWVIRGDSYRGFVCPIKGGRTYTISRSSKSSGRFRFGVSATYPENGTSLLGQTRSADDDLSFTYEATNSNAKYLICYLSNSSEDVSGTNFWVVEGTSAGAYAQYEGNFIETDKSELLQHAVNGTTVCWCDSGDITAGKIEAIESPEDEIKISNSNTGNFSIVCAKEHSYLDGSLPVIEYFLIEEYGTQKFYITKDLRDRKYAFTFDGVSREYSFGIMGNGDIIACKLADALESGKDDSHRENPYCWLASEKWAIQHEVDFGNNIAPCGWLSNCGYKLLANGTALFVEYTRMTVATANVWKVSGDPSIASNWTILKSFTITTEDNNTGFKHIHMVMQDPYTGVIYFSTGDDDDNAMIWYSTDGGSNWTQLGTASQKYCRNLSFTFTEDYIYWAPDTTADSARYLFRAERDANGILDFSNKEDYVHIGGNGTIAAYGTAYIPELEAILILDRSDALTASMPLKLVDLSNGTCHTIATLYAPSETQLVGLRTRFSEWYPHNGLVRFGFGFKTVENFNNVNHIKGFGNAGYSNTGEGAYNINNLVFQVYKNGATWGIVMDTYY